jgi:hypothetical protein
MTFIHTRQNRPRIKRKPQPLQCPSAYIGVRIHISLPQPLYDRLRDCAAQNHLSVPAQLRIILHDVLVRTDGPQRRRISQ